MYKLFFEFLYNSLYSYSIIHVKLKHSCCASKSVPYSNKNSNKIFEINRTILTIPEEIIPMPMYLT